MFTKEDIFKDIQNIISHDYAGCIDKKHMNHPKRYTVSNDMDDRAFEEVIQDYLLDFGDGHLWFASKDAKLPNRGFSVRRSGNALYVTKATREKRLDIGDEITHIDGKDISALALQHYKRLEEELPERQRWDSIIRRSEVIQVRRNRNGENFELNLSNYDPEPYQGIYTFKRFDKETAYIQITDFAEEKSIRELIQNNQKNLSEIRYLMIDVRVNYGGNDAFYFPLLQYIFDRKTQFSELFADDEVMYTNYTERNCQLWIEALKDYMTQDLDESTMKMLEEDIKLIENNVGKGFQEVPEETDFEIKGSSSPEHIYVLSDYYCGSSGDTFVSNVKKSPKVTVVGRATMGIMDYFNVVTVDYGQFEFWYGISKMHDNYSINGKGVEPDIYIPWTPDHLAEDKDLMYVQKLIEKYAD